MCTKQASLLLLLLLLTGFLLVPGCKAVDDATGVNNANVGESLKQANGTLTRKELSSKLRRLAMSYLGDVPEVCETIAASDLPLDKRLLALRIRANSADSVITIAADPDPQVSLLNMVTVLTLQRMLAEQRGEEFFGQFGDSYALATRRMEAEAWKLADQVLDDQEEKELRSLILQYRTDNPEEIYVWWVRFSEFSGYKDRFSVASIGRGVVDLFLPVGDAVAGIETTTDVAERATWLAARQSLIVQWRVELTYLQTLSAPETTRLLKGFEDAAATVDALPKYIAEERKAILKALDEQEGTLNKLITRTQSVVKEVKATTEEANKIVENIDQVMKSADQTVEGIAKTIQQADESIANAKSILPETKETLAQLDTTSATLNETIKTLDTFTRQFESDDDESAGRPFDINEYTLAVQEAGKAAAELNALVNSLDRTANPDRLNNTLTSVKAEFGSLIWLGGFIVLGVGLLLILAAKLVPRRGSMA